jgi:hypothetical protein
MKYEFPTENGRDCFDLCCCAPCSICQNSRGDAYNILFTAE